MIKIDYLDELKKQKAFSRKELLKQMRAGGYLLSESSFKSDLQKMMENGVIARAGRNAYFVKSNDLHFYHYSHSDKAMDIVDHLTKNHPYLTFTIFELCQLNEFMNHQIAHNILFLSVSKDLGESVFESLQEMNQWTLLYPDQKTFHQYWKDGMVIINRLISEAPIQYDQQYSPCLEKILVDIIADKIICESIPESKIPNIFESAFEQYVIDESTLFRYAKRRNAQQKIMKVIREQTKIQLRTMSI